MTPLIIAFAMYSRIPMPRVDWSEKNMRYAMCFFPVIGIVIAAAEYLCFFLCGKLGRAEFSHGAGAQAGDPEGFTYRRVRNPGLLCLSAGRCCRMERGDGGYATGNPSRFRDLACTERDCGCQLEECQKERPAVYFRGWRT